MADELNGVIIINKHKGVTSHDIVFKIRRLFGTKKVGHTGTLDPMAEGVLPVLIGRAAKAAEYAKHSGVAYMKALSACPLNWNDRPDTERRVISAAVDSCYFPLYEVEQGKTRLSYDPEKNGKKIPVLEWLTMMGRTKHLAKEEYRPIVEDLQ